MLVSKKETFTAITYTGTLDSVRDILEAFPGAVLKIYYEDSKLHIEIKTVDYGNEYQYVNEGETVVLDDNFGYAVYSPEVFANTYRVEAKVEDNPSDSEPVWEPYRGNYPPLG